MYHLLIHLPLVIFMNKSTVDALEILVNISGRLESVGCRELAREMGMDHSRMSRFLKSLCESGFIEQDQNRKYHGGAGLQLLTIKNMYSSKLLRASLPVVSRLEPFETIVGVGMLFRQDVCYCFHAEPGDGFAEAIAKLNMFPAMWSAIGMSLLSFKDDEYVRDLYSGCEQMEMWDSIDELLDKLGEIRDLGYCYMPCWRKKGLYSVAMPVGQTPYGAIAFSDFADSEFAYFKDKLTEVICEANGIIESKMDKEFSYKNYI